MVATPFEPSAEDCRGCARVPELGRQRSYARLHMEREQRRHERRSAIIPDVVVSVDVPDAVPIPALIHQHTPPPPQPTANNQSTLSLIVLLLVLAVLTSSITHLSGLSDDSFRRQTDYWHDFNLILAVISCILSLIVGAIVLTTCTYYRDTELPNSISYLMTICAYLIPIINLILATQRQPGRR